MPILNDAVLRLTDGTTEIDLLGPDSGFHMEDPNWNPRIADLKRGGTFVNPAMAEGRTLVQGQEGTVVETIPLSVRSFSQGVALRTIRSLLQMLKQAENYWTEPWEYDFVWLEARPAGSDTLTGYTRLLKGRVSELTNPFGQPFFSTQNLAVMTDLSLVLEREPFWRATPPGQIMGPLYNLIKNPDFELWNQPPGIADSQPDNWTDIETLWISGSNNRQDSAVNSGNHCLRIRVSGSTKVDAAKGVSQVVAGTQSATQYTVIAWTRSEGVSNGVGRVLITYSSQLELYRSSSRHGWTLQSGTFTTGTNDVVAITCEILATAANTDGTIYIDSLMIVPGDWTTEAANGTLPYMSSSHVVNHWDRPQSAQVDAGDINWVDVWNIPGDVDSLIRLEVMNNTAPTDLTDPAEVFEKIRIGQRRTGKVQNFDNYHDPAGVADTTGSGGDRLDTVALTDSWRSITVKTVQDNILDNLGRFRVFARVYDNRASGSPTLEVRLLYFIGTAGVFVKTLQAGAALVRGAWTLVDLTPTAAMIQDAKFQADTPTQLGYTIQMFRATGTETARLDYILAMPTDGGFLEATVTPPLSTGNILIVDNTLSPTVSATLRRGGYQAVFRTGNVPQVFEEFEGDLFVGGDAGELCRFRNGQGECVADYGGSGIQALVDFDGHLHVAHGSQTRRLQQDNFEGSVIFTTPDTIADFATFNGELFVAISGSNGPIYRWDGTTLTLSFTTNQTEVRVLEVYNNRLYAGTGTEARIYEYNPVTDAWTQILAVDAGDATAFRSMRAFKGKLFAGTTPNGRVYIFDGDSWTFNIPSGDLTTIRAMVEHRSRLHVSGTPAGPVQVSDDGETWAPVYDPEPQTPNDMIVFDGALYIADETLKNLNTIAIADLQYKVPNFRGPGNGFTSPHTKRHRWVFSFNRENSRNELDDQALIGLGFVPRYLSLRGDG